MRRVEVKDIEKELLNLFSTKQEDIIWCIHESPLVFKSKLAQLDEVWCKKHNIAICNSFNFGGTIVSDTDDINSAVMRKNGWTVGDSVLEFFKIKLSNIIPDLSINDNDLLYQGKYKMISYASINVGEEFIYTCLHISFNPNIELIKNICTKPMNKIPMGLASFGIKHQDIVDILQEWEQNN